MPLSENHLQHRCLARQGHRECRYLKHTGWKKGECQKLLSGIKRAVDRDVAKHLAELKKAGRDPSQHWKSVGDGGTCPGYLYLPTVLQGYDKKS